MSVGSGERIVTLTEGARTIRLMLTFLYHQQMPKINDFEVLANVLEIAQKYEIESMTSWLRSLFWLENSPIRMRKRPLEVFEIASVYEFNDVVNACFKHCIRKLDLRDEHAVNKFVLTSRHPQAALELVTRLARRWAVLVDTLTHMHDFPMNLRADEWDKTHLDRQTLAASLICDKCRPAYDEVVFSAVSWQSFWAYHALEVFAKEPLSECDHVFKVGFLCKPYHMDEDTVTFCEKCFEQIQLRAHTKWEDWASLVRGQLELRLKDIDST